MSKTGQKTLDREGTKQVYLFSVPKCPRTTFFAKEVFGMQFSKPHVRGDSKETILFFKILIFHRMLKK